MKVKKFRLGLIMIMLGACNLQAEEDNWLKHSTVGWAPSSVVFGGNTCVGCYRSDTDDFLETITQNELWKRDRKGLFVERGIQIGVVDGAKTVIDWFGDKTLVFVSHKKLTVEQMREQHKLLGSFFYEVQIKGED